MTRRDYINVADKVRHHLDAADEAGDGSAVLVIDALARDLAEVFERSNPAFDRGRFLAACSVTR